MESFHWDKYYESGIQKVDDEHKKIVEGINKLGKLVVKNSLAPEIVNTLIGELAEYADYHFKGEEQMMAKKGIDKRHLAAQIEDHRSFLNEITFLHANISEDNPASAKHLLDYLTHWLAYHILGLDQDMARQLQAIENGMDAKSAYDKEQRERNQAMEPLLVALSGLFKQISLRNKELTQLNLSLEDKVAQRTQELNEANRHLEELSLTDALTRLPNRRHAMRALDDLWEDSSKIGTSITCMMIDADHFKQVNDNYGHDAGDDVLIEIAKELQNSMRTDDMVCRLGGDEFLIICPNTDKAGGLHIANVMHKAIMELRVPTGDGCWEGSVSVGVATQIPEMTNYEELVKKADEGVYAAKQDGKNCVRTAK